MKIAMMGDIHANLPAFKAAIRHAMDAGANEIWCAGDLVGYGPFPNQTVDLALKTCAQCVLGNVDALILKAAAGNPPAPTNSLPAKEFTRQWTAFNMTGATDSSLAALPEKIALQRNGLRFLLAHGSPDSIKEKISPLTPPERLRELADAADFDVLVCGHAHIPFAGKIGRVWFVNTGSVGRPDDGDTRACYALADISDTGEFSVSHCRVSYDVGRVLAAMRRKRFPAELIRMTRAGLSLEALPPPGVGNARKTGAALSGMPGEARSAAKKFRADMRHANQVRAIALDLFDALAPLHGLGAAQRVRLECAAWLHDIGWCQGGKGHHKTTMKLILGPRGPRWPGRNRRMVACLARYHRGALPKKSHPVYPDLARSERREICLCGALLRLADGFDAAHDQSVRGATASLAPKRLILRCQTRGTAGENIVAAKEKGAWLEQLLKREIVFAHEP